MKVSTRAEYGIKALLDLVVHYDGQGPVPLREVAQRQEISLDYLHHLLVPLIAAGIVKSTRGARGGVGLAKPPWQISLSEVIHVMEGSTAPAGCADDPERCSQSAVCATRDIWIEIKEAVEKILGSITLQDLAEQQKRKQRDKSLMYHI